MGCPIVLVPRTGKYRRVLVPSRGHFSGKGSVSVPSRGHFSGITVV
jgi:hypothetical protein